MQDILNKIEKLKKAYDSDSDETARAAYSKRIAILQAQIAEAEQKIEKKEEASTEEKKTINEVEEKIKKLETAIASETDPDTKARYQKALDKHKVTVQQIKTEGKEEKKEIAEEKKEVKEAAKEVEKIVKKVEVAEKKQQKDMSDADDKIKRLEKAIATQADEDVKNTLRKRLKAEKEKVSDIKQAKPKKVVRKTPIKKAAPAPTPSPRKKKLKGVLAELDALIEKNRRLKAKYGTSYKGTGKPSDLERDSKRKAKPFGYRFVGKHNYRVPTEMEIKKGLKRGTIDYEARPNRADVSVKRKVKLEDGGLINGWDDNQVIKFIKQNLDEYYENREDYFQRASELGLEYDKNSKTWSGDLSGYMDEYKKGGKTKEKWIQFATRFSYNAGTLPTGTYTSDDKKFVIKYLPTIEEDGVEQTTPARIDIDTGIIEISKKQFLDFTVPNRLAILLHEFSHVYALAGKKGALRATAKKKGLLRGDENLSKTDLKKLQKVGGKTAKRAHLAETLSKFKKGGKVGNSDEDKARFAKPAGWRWKEEAFKKGFITRTQLAQKPSKYMRDKYPTMVYYEDRLNKSDKKPTRTSAPSV